MSSMKARMRALEAQLAELRVAQTVQVQASLPSIQRPSKGSAGDGFNLEKEMGLADDHAKYRAITRTIRNIVNGSHLDWRLPWYRQDKTKVGRIFILARKRQPYLKCFPRDWATEEYLKSHLKNKRRYNRKIGLDVDEDELAGATFADEDIPMIDQADEDGSGGSDEEDPDPMEVDGAASGKNTDEEKSDDDDAEDDEEEDKED
ncbi:uncharacterized protein C8Q71DRAFT_903221 [Rhodofomes roseus]|nr:uncharacterized protein C8Q71DRAFT_903221 [Rhodofomes roseus]KAH9844116.1 hypothetical protein C8Q71DRAFT_903221 [Rhodofomes roseus]